MKATDQNLRGSVEKLSPKESVKGADTVLRGSLRDPEGFSEEKPKVLQLMVCPHTAPQHSVGTQGILLRGQLFRCAPRIFNSCSDYQNHEVYWRMKQTVSVFDGVYN